MTSKIISIFCICFLIFGQSLSAQSQLALNQDFLNSLPDETREELLKQIEADQEKLDKVDYGAISTMMNKSPAERFIEQELLKEKSKDIPSQYLSLSQLDIFGMDFFSDLSPSTFMPISEPALSSDYYLDIGDKLNINLIGGSRNETLDLLIMQDGAVAITGIGSVQVAGLSLGDASKKIEKFLQSKVPGLEALVQLSEIRDIQVVIVGYVNEPGIYTLSGNSNILSAIRVAGGISRNGSYRNISIKRNGKVLDTYDMYSLLVYGENNFNTALRAGDSIIVSSVGPQVSIYGGVSNPAIYEVKDNETIQDVINFAGNGLNGYSIDSVNLSRLDLLQRRSTKVDIQEFRNMSLRNQDQIFVQYFEDLPSSDIKLIGSFLNPGSYSLESINLLNGDFKTSKDAYTNAFFLKKFNQASMQFSYEAVNPSSIMPLNNGDELISLSSIDIEFIQSNEFRSFINNSYKDLSNSCLIYKNLEDIRSTGRFQRAAQLFKNSIDSDPTDKEAYAYLESLPASLSDIDPNSSDNKSLFTNNNAYNNSKTCPKVFQNDTELLLAVIQNSILVDGPSVKGGIYPVFPGIQLVDIINSLAFFSQINGNENVSVTQDNFSINTSLQNIGSETINPGSNITISSLKTINSNQVTIKGEVNMPGTYFISSGDRLSSLIKRAGGYTSNAYPVGGNLSRLSARNYEIDYNEKLYKEIVKNLSSEIVKGGTIPYQTISYILNEFRNIEPTGRVIAEFNLPILNENISKDIILENGDIINIPKKSNIVYVFGEVINPGPQVFSSDYDVNDYISSAGGYTRFVEKSSVIIVYPDGRSKIVKPSFLFSDQSIIPGSVIYASRDLRKLDSITLASTVAPIISSIAISLASLNSISNN